MEPSRACYAFSSVRSPAAKQAIIFYDGCCVICHGLVKFVLRHDRTGDAFRFAPLRGATFNARVPPDQRLGLADSVVVLTWDNRVLTRSEGILYILRQLEGSWKSLAAALAMIPLPVREAVYDVIARVRYRVFGRTRNSCPTVPTDLLRRFDP